jgi:Egh16-like virulence factor
MVFHQINGDGAGPIACSISTDATGKTFTDITVSTNVPGTNGKSNAANQDFPLVANIPAGTACTGAVGALKNVCAVKCANPAGPFGGTVLIQISGGKKRDVLGGSLAARAKAIIE